MEQIQPEAYQTPKNIQKRNLGVLKHCCIFVEMNQHDTIIALATPSGMGAIAVIRISGPEAIRITDSIFQSIHQKKLIHQK